MNNLAERRDRYMRDSLAIRLGGLAANLARVASFVTDFRNKNAVHGLLEESKYFIEWAAPEASSDVLARLVSLQLTLAIWQRGWDATWENEINRLEIGQRAKRFSNDVLADSGLLNNK